MSTIYFGPGYSVNTSLSFQEDNVKSYVLGTTTSSEVRKICQIFRSKDLSKKRVFIFIFFRVKRDNISLTRSWIFFPITLI